MIQLLSTAEFSHTGEEGAHRDNRHGRVAPSGDRSGVHRDTRHNGVSPSGADLTS